MAGKSAETRVGMVLAAAIVAFFCVAVVRGSTEPRPSGATLGKGQFLIASRKLLDPRFEETVVLLIEYGESGAIGLVINQRSELRITTLLPNLEELRGSTSRVFLGGPVAQHGMLLLIRSDQPPKASVRVFADVHASGSLEVLREHGKIGEKKLRAYMGYAGWAGDQLEAEVARGDWHVVPGNSADVFADDTESVWPQLIRSFEGQWARRGRVRSSERCRASLRSSAG